MTLVLVAGAAAASGPQPLNAQTACRRDLEQKSDKAVASCLKAYASHPSVLTAKEVVNAYTPRGDAALAELLAFHPVDPIGAEIWHKRGGRLRDAGNTDDAIRVYQRALALRAGDLEGQVRELAALSERYWARVDVREALAVQARAYETALRLGDPLTLAHVRVALSIELGQIGDEQGAEHAMADSVDHLSSDDPYRPQALVRIATNYRFHDRTALARKMFEEVLTLGDPVAADDARRNLINLAFGEGRLDEARRMIATDPSNDHAAHEVYRARLALAEGRLDDAMKHTRAAGPTDGDQLSTIEAMQGEVLAKQHHDREAIELLERSIVGFEADIDRLGFDELKAWAQRDGERRAPYEHLFAIYARSGEAMNAFAIAQRATARAYLDGLAGSRGATQDLAALTRADGVRAEALHQIARSLRSSAATRGPNPKLLREELVNATVWTFFAADGEAWLAVLDHGSASVDDLGPLGALKPMIAGAARLDDRALAELGAVLAPHGRWPQDPDAVIHLVAGAPFDGIPFAALEQDHRRWIERAAFVHVPNAMVLSELARRGGRASGIHVLGDPLGDLPGARAEAAATGARFHISARLLGQARRQAVFEARNAELLAIASHAEATSGGAQLHLADGPLTVGDVIDHAVAPRLVVLASCSSAAVGVDAWGALAGAFLAAGASNVIASEWALDDSISRDLLEEFYDADGLHRPALALALAQRKAIAHHVPVSAWASLVALGTGENTYQSRGN